MILGMNYVNAAVLGNYRKITISVPDYLYQQVTKIAKPGEISKFITDAVLNKISAMFLTTETDPWNNFLNAKKYISKINTNISTREAIDRGRL